jgi:phosphate transport system ATP-binding protein
VEAAPGGSPARKLARIRSRSQAARASDFTVFLNMDDDRAGYVVEQGPTAQIFTNPTNQMTEDYVSGRFG